LWAKRLVLPKGVPVRASSQGYLDTTWKAARQFGLDSDSSFFPNPPPAKIRRGPLSNQSAISSVFYDPKSQTLEIEFKSSGVPNDEYQRLLKAASKGAYLNSQIKPKYRTRKIL
jgi:hypothetical protein